LTESSQELMLGNMLVLGNVKVLEHWFQVNSFNSNSLSIMVKNFSYLLLLIGRYVEVRSSGWHGEIVGDWGHYSGWLLLDAVRGEGCVDVCAERLVVEHDLWIISLVLQSEGVELLGAQVEVEHGEDGLELVLGDLSLPELVEVEEELFDSDTLHDDHGLQSELDVEGVVGNLDPLLLEPVVDDVEALGGDWVVTGAGISELTVEDGVFCDWVLGSVFWEKIFWLIDISTELEVVDLSNVSFVQILSNEQLEEFFTRSNERELLHDSSELLTGDMAAIGSVVILERWLN
jgi:hypothetical protein